MCTARGTCSDAMAAILLHRKWCCKSNAVHHNDSGCVRTQAVHGCAALQLKQRIVRDEGWAHSLTRTCARCQFTSHGCMACMHGKAL